MLADARPLIADLPGAYADPLGLAAQGAPGACALVVVRHGVGADYDALLAVGGQVACVARVTPEFRFPVAPARALRRFVEARAAGRPLSLSLYALSEEDARRFLASTLLAPCLKVCVAGAADAPLLVAQLRAAGCTRGLVEVNSFADAARPRLRFRRLAPDQAPLDEDAAAALLDGLTGRALVYDDDRNAHVAPDRGLEAFDLDAALAQAARLADARHAPASAALERLDAARSAHAHAALATPDEHALLEALHAESLGAARASEPLPSAMTLAALLAGDPVADPLSLLLPALDAAPDPPAPPSDPAALAAPMPVLPVPSAHPPLLAPFDSSPPPDVGGRPGGGTAATELVALASTIAARVHEHVGDAAFAELDAHARAAHDPSEEPLGYLDVLLTGPLPRRRFGLKAARRRAYHPAADALLAWFRAHRESNHPATLTLPALWHRLNT